MRLGIEVEVGAAIRRLREARGLSQKELAIRCDVERTYIGTVERGESSVTLRNLAKVANGLHMPLSAVLLEAETTSQDVAKTMRPLAKTWRSS